eukprot:12449734-Heterocapsa_arctica.AAC.1
MNRFITSRFGTPPAGASNREGNRSKVIYEIAKSKVIEEIAKTWYKQAGAPPKKDNRSMSPEEIAKARREAASGKKGQAAKQETLIPKAKAQAKAQFTQHTVTPSKDQPALIEGKLHPVLTKQGQGPRLPPPKESRSSKS